jgi:ribosomal protein S18 acetylase RimI-like enzyme
VYGREKPASPEYLAVLRNAQARWESPATAIFVAHDDGAENVVGTVVYAAPGSRWQDLAIDGEVEIRMLATAPAARGRGVGEALVRACIKRAKDDGAPRLVLSTRPAMLAAHRLYERLGFMRVPERDWRPTPEMEDLLKVYVLEL